MGVSELTGTGMLWAYYTVVLWVYQSCVTGTGELQVYYRHTMNVLQVYYSCIRATATAIS